jgi:hypothetical protein
MAFYPANGHWYCYVCMKYPFFPKARQNLVDTCATRKSIIGLIINTTAIIGVFLVILVLVSIILLNNGLIELIDPNYSVSLDEHPFPRGILLAGLSIGLILAYQIFLNRTIQDKNWWKKLMKKTDKGFTETMDEHRMKERIVGIYQTFYGLIIFSGMIAFFVGIIYMLNSGKFLLFTIFVIEIILGMVIILESYLVYSSEIDSITDNIHPILKEIPEAKK